MNLVRSIMVGALAVVSTAAMGDPLSDPGSRMRAAVYLWKGSYLSETVGQMCGDLSAPKGQPTEAEIKLLSTCAIWAEVERVSESSLTGIGNGEIGQRNATSVLSFDALSRDVATGVSRYLKLPAVQRSLPQASPIGDPMAEDMAKGLIAAPNPFVTRPQNEYFAEPSSEPYTVDASGLVHYEGKTYRQVERWLVEESPNTSTVEATESDVVRKRREWWANHPKD